MSLGKQFYYDLVISLVYKLSEDNKALGKLTKKCQEESEKEVKLNQANNFIDVIEEPVTFTWHVS